MSNRDLRLEIGDWRLAIAAGFLALSLFLPAFPVFPSSRLSAQDIDNGKVLYEKWCAGCHGLTGAGDGEAADWMIPRPRDFTMALYQIRTTASGELPTDDDLRKVIDEGMPGTTMPGWRDKFNSSERGDVIAYIKSFSRFFEGADPQSIEIGGAPRVTDEGCKYSRRYMSRLQSSKNYRYRSAPAIQLF